MSDKHDEYSLYLGDSAQLLKSFEAASVDMVLTSPPYDNLRSYNGAGEGWTFPKFSTIAKELYRVVKPGGVVVWVVSDAVVNGSETGTSFKQALYFIELGFNLHDTMIYQKANPIPLNHNRYEQAFEYMFVLSKGKPKAFNPIMVRCLNAGKVSLNANRTTFDANQARKANGATRVEQTRETKRHINIFKYTVGGGKSGHPAPFPYKLARDQVITWSNKGDTVLDPFSGSGTTGVACIKEGRRYIGCEIVTEYYEISKRRIEEALLQPRLLEV